MKIEPGQAWWLARAAITGAVLVILAIVVDPFSRWGAALAILFLLGAGLAAAAAQDLIRWSWRKAGSRE